MISAACVLTQKFATGIGLGLNCAFKPLRSTAIYVSWKKCHVKINKRRGLVESRIAWGEPYRTKVGLQTSTLLLVFLIAITVFTDTTAGSHSDATDLSMSRLGSLY